MRKEFKLLVAFIWCSIACLEAQVSIVACNLPEKIIDKRGLMSAQIESKNNESSVSFAVKILESNQAELLNFLTAPIKVQVGINTITGQDLTFVKTFFSNSYAGQYVRNSSLLPNGNYVYVLEVLVNGATIDQWTEEFQVEGPSLLSLVSPEDNAVINELYPLLFWNLAKEIPRSGSSENYRMTLVEVVGEQSAEQAIALNPPLLYCSPLREFSVRYPESNRQLRAGKKYAWQVQCMYNGNVSASTDIWSFSIENKNPLTDTVFVEFTPRINVTPYKAINNKLYFSYIDECGTISKTNLLVQIQAKGKVLEAIAQLIPAEKNKERDATNQNRYYLDLTENILDLGVYEMTTIDCKNRKATLKFEISER